MVSNRPYFASILPHATDGENLSCFFSYGLYHRADDVEGDLVWNDEFVKESSNEVSQEF